MGVPPTTVAPLSLPDRSRLWAVLLLLPGVAFAVPARSQQPPPATPPGAPPPGAAAPAGPVAGPPGPPALAAARLAAQITVFSDGVGPDVVAVAYDETPTDEAARGDLAGLARRLGAPPPAVKLTRGAGILVAEANLPGLVNWSTGVVELDAVAAAFGRFDHFRVSCFFTRSFPLRGALSVDRPPVRIEGRATPNTIDYLIWVDQARSSPPKEGGENTPALPWPLVGVLAAAAAIGAAAFVFVFRTATQRRAARAGEGNPVDAAGSG